MLSNQSKSLLCKIFIVLLSKKRRLLLPHKYLGDNQMKHIGKMCLITITALSSLTLEIKCTKIHAEISYGELVDKITILTIKSERITDKEKLNNIHIELDSLEDTFELYVGDRSDVLQIQKELKHVNETLWEIEDALRDKERKQEFDDEFTQLARNVYKTNDERMRLKKKIDILLGSHITEEKSYKPYLIEA